MLANTLTLTINSVAYVLTRVGEQNGQSKYTIKSATEEITLLFRHSVETGGPEPFYRHNMAITWIVYATPSATEKTFTSSTVTRCNRTADPEALEDLLLAHNVLLSAQASAFTDGEP